MSLTPLIRVLLCESPQVASLKSKISQVSQTKRDQTLGTAAKTATLHRIRAPPQVKQRRILKGHFGKITAIHWGSDSRHLVSASQDGNILYWNAVSSNKLKSIALKSSYVMSVGLEQTQGNLVACGGLDNLCTVYPLDNPGAAVEMASHDGFLTCCRFLSPEEILTSSGDSTCIRWDITTSQPISTFTEHTADAMWISLKPGDANVFASSSVDLTTKLWDIRAPDKAIQTFWGAHTSDINAVEFIPSNANCLATCGQDNTVKVYDVRAYNEVASFALNNAAAAASNNNNNGNGMVDGGGMESSPANNGFSSLSFSHSGRLVFCGHADGSVYAFDLLSANTGPAFQLAQVHERNVSSVAVSPAGDAVASASWDGLIKIWA